MTTFQDPPHQSRRALRESEREDRQAADATSQSREMPAPAPEPLVPPAATPNGEQPASVTSVSSVASVSSVVEPDSGEGAPVVRSSGRRASRAAAQPGLIELQNSDGSASKAAAEGEPLDYATKGRRQVPSYDGPGPSFAQRLREAEATSSRHDAEVNATGEQPQYRVRDFSPEGRRSAAYPSQPTPVTPAPAAEQAPADLDYRTQAAPAPGSAPSAFEASVPEPTTVESTTTGDSPALWSPRVAPAEPFPLVEPSAPASAFVSGPASAPEIAAPHSAAFPESATEAPVSEASAEEATPAVEDVQPDAAQPETVQPETVQFDALQPQAVQFEAVQPETVQFEAAQPETVQLDEVQAEVEQPAPHDSAEEHGFTPPAPQPPATPASSFSASVSHPDSVTESNGIPMTRRELREMRAREEAAAAALIEPEVPVATPAAVSNAIAEFEELSRAAHNTAPVEQITGDGSSPEQENPVEQFEAPVAPQPMANFWAPAEPESQVEAPVAPQPLADDWAAAPAAPEPLGDAWAPAPEPVADAWTPTPADTTEPTPDAAPAASPSSLFSTNQPFSNWLPAEPITPAASVAEQAPAAPPVDSVASVHSAPVPLEAIIADAESVPDSSIPRPFHWAPPVDESAPAAEAAPEVAPKPTPDPHATSFEELFAPVTPEPQAPEAAAAASVPEAAADSGDGAYTTGDQSAADLFSQALAAAAPPAYTPPVAEPVEDAPAPVYEAPKFDFANFAPPSFPSAENAAAEPERDERTEPEAVVEPELSLPAPPEEAAPSTDSPASYSPAASSPSGTASAFNTPTPAATPQDFLTPEFVEPPTTTNSTYVAPVGHWSRQAIMDDETQPFENTLSREVGGGNVATTTSALILPTIPQQDFGTALTGTGEVLVTGTIDLPESFGTMGGDSRRYDNPDVDHVFDAFDNEVVSTDSAPVRATRAVSTHTNTHGVIHTPKTGSDGRLRVLIIAASALAVCVVALLIVAVLNK